MGGIPTNVHTEVVNPTRDDANKIVPGLMAVGKQPAFPCTARTARLEFAARPRRLRAGAAIQAAKVVTPGAAHKRLPADAGHSSIARLDKARNAKGGTRTAHLRLKMQKDMQDHCAVFRTGDL